ncbi:hypothetical protein HK097_004866 [Rhizophlyctis rosea]|uniref:Uncharacterized protein n=1 Tax=Rhizophlyctis rosea TaxID=64517 RepID=A0AAD5X8D9_9FUNG|nr:hypothetical protein HK097_004866 [Rhizophlyctis rosea]
MAALTFDERAALEEIERAYGGYLENDYMITGEVRQNLYYEIDETLETRQSHLIQSPSSSSATTPSKPPKKSPQTFTNLRKFARPALKNKQTLKTMSDATSPKTLHDIPRPAEGVQGYAGSLLTMKEMGIHALTGLLEKSSASESQIDQAIRKGAEFGDSLRPNGSFGPIKLAKLCLQKPKAKPAELKEQKKPAMKATARSKTTSQTAKPKQKNPTTKKASTTTTAKTVPTNAPNPCLEPTQEKSTARKAGSAEAKPDTTHETTAATKAAASKEAASAATKAAGARSSGRTKTEGASTAALAKRKKSKKGGGGVGGCICGRAKNASAIVCVRCKRWYVHRLNLDSQSM